MEQKPRIFIGSSKDNVKYAHAVHQFINNTYAHSKLWETAVKPSEYTLPALIKTFDKCEYGIFIFSEDDIVKIREREYQTVRDNVLFEFGLFIGKQGIENAFIIAPDKYLERGRIPSDLFGITIEIFDSTRHEDELQDTISSSCLSIISKIKSIKAQEENLREIASTPYYGICSHESHMYTELVYLFSSAREKIILVITNIERMIIFDLFISFINAKKNGVSIDIYYYPQVTKDENSYSIEILRQLGCSVKAYPVGIYPQNGVVFISDPGLNDNSIMILKTDDLKRKNVFAYIYKGAIHHLTIKSYVQNLEVFETNNDRYIPEIVTVSENEIQKQFSEIPLYKQNNCRIEIKKIKAKSTFPQSQNQVREFKLRQIDVFDSLFSKLGFDLYEPKAVVFKNGQKHLITPPVVEMHEGRYLVAEGHSRLFKYSKTESEIICVVVSGINLSLLSTPTEWKNILMAPDEIVKMKTSNKTDLQRARRIETYLHKGHWFVK